MKDHGRQLDLDTQILADFIYELNISRRHLAIYPPGHPLVADTTDKVLSLLQPLLEFREELCFGVAQNALMLEYGWLDKNNPVFCDFANFLFQYGIASLRFRRYPDRNEIIQLNQLLSTDVQTIAARGGLPTLLKTRQTPHIEIVPVDYQAFQASEELTDQSAQPSDLWEEFLQGLMAGSLDPDGIRKDHDSFDPQLVAEILNRQHTSTGGETALSYDTEISTFIHRLEQPGTSQQTLGKELSGLIGHLNPDLRRQFLNSTFRTLDSRPENAGNVLDGLPRELILSSIEDCNNNRLNISPSMLNLLGQLAQISTEDRPHSIIGNGAAQQPKDADQQIQTIFREEEVGKFIPDSYQVALDTISAKNQQTQLDHEELEQLRNTLSSQSVEHRTAAIIFELMTPNLEPEQNDSLQRNLLDLGYYFLETGDFIALGDLHRRWSNHHDASRTVISIFSDELPLPLSAPSFLQDALDSFPNWGEDKLDDIIGYVRSVGSPMADGLIEQLVTTEDRNQRHVFIEILVGMDKLAHESIFATLDDAHWTLLRDLLTVLERQSAPTIFKKVYPFLQHPHAEVHREALRILYKYNRAKADQLLLQDLSSLNPERQINAVQIAGYSSDRTVFNRLLILLNQDDLTDETLRLKCRIIKTLAELDKVQALPHLQRILKSTGLLRSQLRKQLKREVVLSLGDYSATAATDLLSKLVRSGNRELSVLATEQLQRRSERET